MIVMPKIKTIHGVEDRKVVSQKEWIMARRKLLAKEKKFSRLRDELNRERRRLPWAKVEKGYVFHGPTGKVMTRFTSSFKANERVSRLVLPIVAQAPSITMVFACSSPASYS